MANTLLTCPHCASALSFGMEIPAGTPIECLICMQTFAAEPIVESAVEVPLANPTSPPVGIMVAEKARPAPPPIPTAARASAPARRPQPPSSGNAGLLSLIAVGLGVVCLSIVGIGFAVWKIGTPRNDTNAVLEVAGGEEFAPPTSPGVLKPGNPAMSDLEEDDEMRRKLEAEKVLLARKNPIKLSGADLEFAPIDSVHSATTNVAGLDQKKINMAIAKGVVYLKRTQNGMGSWHNGHDLGYAAIGGLTLLESGVPVNDPAVGRAAAYVRANAAYHKKTYEMSLAVLFLDRIGDPRDRVLIQWLSLRLLAGQNDSGGWSYDCPVFSPQEMHKLYSFLQSHRPALQNPLLASAATPLRDPLAPDPKQANGPLQQFNNMIFEQGIHGGKDDPLPAKKGAVAPPPAKGKANKTPPPISPMLLMPSLRGLPVVQNQGKKKGQQAIRAGGGDNSNTQFALLALWTARRHNIPTDAALVFAYQRFAVSQSPDGGWGYHHNIGQTTNTMTSVGLLGEAMGHGAAPDVIGFNPKNPKEPIIRPVLEDPAIRRGLTKLADYIGEPSKDSSRTAYPMQNLYFLWSVERVAMLYDLKTINGKDWYGWGAQILVYNQQPDGAWIHGQFHGESGPINTCLALLFLKRSNLVQDLTNQIRLNSAIRE